jgi:hypothetical protein
MTIRRYVFQPNEITIAQEDEVIRQSAEAMNIAGADISIDTIRALVMRYGRLYVTERRARREYVQGVLHAAMRVRAVRFPNKIRRPDLRRPPATGLTTAAAVRDPVDGTSGSVVQPGIHAPVLAAVELARPH